MTVESGGQWSRVHTVVGRLAAVGWLLRALLATEKLISPLQI